MARIGLQFDGFVELLEKMNKMEANIKEPVEEALNVSADLVTEQLHKEMKKHHFTGQTEESIRENPRVKWRGNLAEVSYGFDIKKGGLPAIFLERGTPKQKPTPVIKPAIGKTKAKVKAEQERILLEALGKAGGK